MKGLNNFRFYDEKEQVKEPVAALELPMLGALSPAADLDDLIYGTDAIGIDRELSSRGMIEFMECAWSQVLPGERFIRSWHNEAVCEHLQAVVDEEITRLVINVPPGSTKSLTCCVFLPAYTWIRRPDRRFIFASYNDQLSRRDSLRTRALITDDWFQLRWGDIVKPNKEAEWSGRYFANTAGGCRKMTTIGGGVTGEHAHIQVVDDPVKPLDITGSLATSKSTLENVAVWWNETMATRLVDFEKSARIIIMQRLHQGDLAGRVLAEGGYEHLMLPMEFEPKRKCFTSIGFEDPRTEQDELLCPERFPPEAVAKLTKELGPRGSTAQLQQDPTPATGTVFLREQLIFYEEAPTKFDLMIHSWDCTFKETQSGSFVTGQIWGMKNANYYLLDQWRKRAGLSETCRALEGLVIKWPKAYQKVIEDKANGAAVVDTLKQRVSGLKLVTPLGGKEARANAVEPLWDSGNVFLPSRSIAPWIDSFVEEIIAFPAGLNDDQVDAMSQALTFLMKKNINKLRKAMENVRMR